MMSSSKSSHKITRSSSSSAGEDVDHNSGSPEVTSDGTGNSAAIGSPASTWYPGGGGYGYPAYPSSPQQPGAYPGYPQWNPYTAHYPGYGGYTGWDYSSGTNAAAPPPPPGSTSVSSPLPAPPPPPPSTTSIKSSTESRDKSSSSATKLPQPPLPPLPPPAFGLPPPPPPGPPPPPSSLASLVSTNDEPKPKEKESREERKRRKKEKKKKEREERERDRAHRSKHEKTSSSEGIPTVKSYAAALKDSSSKEDKDTDSKNKSSSKEETPTCAPPPPPAPPAVLTAAAATSPPGVSAVAGGVVFPPPDFSKPPPPPPPPPMSSQDQSDGKLGSAAETSGHPPLQPPPMPPPYGAFDLNVPPPGFTPPNFPPPKHGFHNMGGPGAPGGPPGPYGGGFANNWYDGDQRGGPSGNGRFGRPGGPYNSPFGKPPGEDEGGQHGNRMAPYDEIGEGRHPPGGPNSGHIKFNFPAKNSFTKQNALLETPPTKPQWNPNRLGGDIRGGMYRDSPMMDQQGDRDNVMGPRGPNRRNLNNWRSDMQSEGVMPSPGSVRDDQTATPKPLMARLENTNFGAKVPSKDSLAKGGAGPSNKQQQSQQDVANMMKGEWPDALKRYVERCFAKCVTDLDKDQVEIVLKGKLTAAAKTGTLWTHKWDAEPMPSVHSDDMFAKIRNQFPTRSADTNSVGSSTTTAANHNSNNSITSNKGSPDKRSSDLGGRGRRGHRQHGSRFSKSRSRSRSRSPYGRDNRHRRDSRRRYSPSPDDSRSTNSNNVIPIGNNNIRGAKRGRGSGSAFSRGGSMSSRLSHTNVKEDDSTSPAKDKESGEPKLNAYGGPEEDVFGVASPPNFKVDANKQPNKKMRMDGKEKDPRNDIYFYSKGGKMTLDADLATAAHLQKRAARFQGMMGGGTTTPAVAVTAAPVTAAPSATPSVGRGRGNRGGLLGKRGRGRGRGAAASAAAVSTTPSIVSTINASLFAVDTGDMDWTAMHVVGTCTEIKKQYLRLTSAPDPSTVRTLATLYKSLEFVKEDWMDKKDYRYTCNQMKSIRQDLTVQGIRDSFTIKVYEVHCRIALETADHEEFNQCQSQLKQLYAEVPGAPNALEFMAYRMLYYIYTKNTLDMTSLMAELTPKHKADECIAFALNLRAAWAMSNYYRFFKLFQNAPKMAGYLVDWFAERERKTAIKIMVKGYRPGSIAIEYVKSQLAIADSDWAKFADTLGVLYTDNTRTSIDCKTTVLAA